MNTYKNKHFIKINYECTNKVACQAKQAPNENWEECNEDILQGLTPFYKKNDVKYYGYL